MQHRKLSKQELPNVPISQFRVVQHKLGFKPVIACSCGAVLNLNTTKKGMNKAFFAEHELCLPEVTRGVEVAQETDGNTNMH